MLKKKSKSHEVFSICHDRNKIINIYLKSKVDIIKSENKFVIAKTIDSDKPKIYAFIFDCDNLIIFHYLFRENEDFNKCKCVDPYFIIGDKIVNYRSNNTEIYLKNETVDFYKSDYRSIILTNRRLICQKSFCDEEYDFYHLRDIVFVDFRKSLLFGNNIIIRFPEFFLCFDFKKNNKAFYENINKILKKGNDMKNLDDLSDKIICPYCKKENVNTCLISCSENKCEECGKEFNIKVLFSTERKE